MYSCRHNAGVPQASSDVHYGKYRWNLWPATVTLASVSSNGRSLAQQRYIISCFDMRSHWLLK